MIDHERNAPARRQAETEPGSAGGAETIRRLESRIEQIEHSMSWRLTAPLRSLMQALRRVRNRPKGFEQAADPDLPAAPDALGRSVEAVPEGPRRTTILILDYTIPKPDQDAGSRAIMDLMLCLVESGWRICFWPQDRMPDHHYGGALELLGIEVLDSRWPGDLTQWIARHGPGVDHVLVSRATVAEALAMPIIAGCAARLTFYGHDIASARLEMELQHRNTRQLAEAAARARVFERRLWRLFDQVIYLSEEEAALVRALEPGARAVSIIPFSFENFVERAGPPAGQTVLFVAGFAHAPNRDAAEFLVHQILPLVWQACPQARLALVGSQPTRAVTMLAGPRIEVTGWVSDAELAARYGQSRVAAVPLRFGAGVKGKVVQALQQALPLVTTPVGAQGIAGLEAIAPISDDPAALAAAIVRLLQDDTAWAAQSRAQSAYAKANYSRAAMRASILKALGGAYAGAPPRSSLP